MNKYRIATVMSFLAALCFFLAYMFGSREKNFNLILGGTWLCIGVGNLFNTKKINNRK